MYSALNGIMGIGRVIISHISVFMLGKGKGGG